MYSQRILIIVWALSCCGLLIADPRHSGIASSAKTRVSATIPPHVEVERLPSFTLNQLTATSGDYLCLTRNGTTEYTVTAEGRSDITLNEITSTEGTCSASSNIAFKLDIPVDNNGSADFGNQLTLMVSAE